MRKFGLSPVSPEFLPFRRSIRKYCFSTIKDVDYNKSPIRCTNASSSSSYSKFNNSSNRRLMSTTAASTLFQDEVIFSSPNTVPTKPSSSASLNSNASNASMVASPVVTATAVSPITMSEKVKKELPPPITITSHAIIRIKEILHGKEGEFIGVKVGVKRRGCNGYSYTMNYATQEDKTSGKYEVVKIQGEENSNLFVLVDKKAVFFLVGTSMHWEETELSSEFTFNNPNAKGSCGCGESFNI